MPRYDRLDAKQIYSCRMLEIFAVKLTSGFNTFEKTDDAEAVLTFELRLFKQTHIFVKSFFQLLKYFVFFDIPV